MKSLFIITLTSFCLFSCTNNDANEDHNTLDGKFESKSSLISTNAILRGWSDKQGCLHGYGDCAIAIIKDGYPAEGLFSVHLGMRESSKMVLTYTGSEISEDEGHFLNFRNDVEISSEIANDLGYSTITVKAGMYEINRSEDPKGKVILNVEAY